jgi:2-polyprenyl-3-methyl-5-hydroxy-6-metoxy-1,4-benzoquinol methylase
VTTYQYAGSELEIFEKARNWKAYLRRSMQPYLAGSVLEVGAGLGANTRQFAALQFDHWTCLEPDAALLGQIHLGEPLLDRHEVILGDIGALDRAARFDAILYIDVLEHIQDDSGELRRASAHLNPGGALIVLSPAHPWLFTPFDRAIGHYRRYTKASLRAAAPGNLHGEKLIYLDSVGMLASLGNRLLLDSSMPTAAQIKTWDSVLVPCSRWLDPLLGGTVGKSVLGVWRSV